MKRPSKTLANGIHCHVQKLETDGDCYNIGVCVSLPSKDPKVPASGIFMLEDDAKPWITAIERAGWYDWHVEGMYRDVSGPKTASPFINGTFGVWYSKKGRMTQKRINFVFERVCKITAKAKLSS